MSSPSDSRNLSKTEKSKELEVSEEKTQDLEREELRRAEDKVGEESLSIDNEIKPVEAEQVTESTLNKIDEVSKINDQIIDDNSKDEVIASTNNDNFSIKSEETTEEGNQFIKDEFEEMGDQLIGNESSLNEVEDITNAKLERFENDIQDIIEKSNQPINDEFKQESNNETENDNKPVKEKVTIDNQHTEIDEVADNEFMGVDYKGNEIADSEFMEIDEATEVNEQLADDKFKEKSSLEIGNCNKPVKDDSIDNELFEVDEIAESEFMEVDEATEGNEKLIENELNEKGGLPIDNNAKIIKNEEITEGSNKLIEGDSQISEIEKDQNEKVKENFIHSEPEPLQFVEFSPSYEAQLMNRATIHLLNSVGFSTAKQSAIDQLTNLTISYLHDLSLRCKRLAEHANRTKPNLYDIEAVFDEIGLSLDEVEMEAEIRSDAYPIRVPKPATNLTPDSPFFPLPGLTQTSDESSVKLPRSLPNFPSQHTYMNTEEVPKRNDDPDFIRQCNAKQTRQVEENLNRLLLQQPKPKHFKLDHPTSPTNNFYHPQSTFANFDDHDHGPGLTEPSYHQPNSQSDFNDRRSDIDFEDELFEEIQSQDDTANGYLEPINGTSTHLETIQEAVNEVIGEEEDSSDGERPFANYADTKFYHLERGSSLKNSAELNNTNGNSNLN